MEDVFDAGQTELSGKSFGGGLSGGHLRAGASKLSIDSGQPTLGGESFDNGLSGRSFQNISVLVNPGKPPGVASSTSARLLKASRTTRLCPSYWAIGVAARWRIRHTFFGERRVSLRRLRTFFKSDTSGISSSRSV
jgi:hypothetical protein